MDIGCGVASKLAYLHEQQTDLNFVGIDQPNPIDYCNSVHNFGTWITDNFENPSGILKTVATPDLIVCSDVIEHLQDPNILLKYIKDAAKPETLIILSTPNRDRLREKIAITAQISTTYESGMTSNLKNIYLHRVSQLSSSFIKRR
jgi:2-polyprenyl-3-methyl-5-hydroxy-6-metoxy-1,4-benzoquinol methylase